EPHKRRKHRERMMHAPERGGVDILVCPDPLRLFVGWALPTTIPIHRMLPKNRQQKAHPCQPRDRPLRPNRPPLHPPPQQHRQVITPRTILYAPAPLPPRTLRLVQNRTSNP